MILKKSHSNLCVYVCVCVLVCVIEKRLMSQSRSGTCSVHAGICRYADVLCGHACTHEAGVRRMCLCVQSKKMLKWRVEVLLMAPHYFPCNTFNTARPLHAHIHSLSHLRWIQWSFQCFPSD